MVTIGPVDPGAASVWVEAAGALVAAVRGGDRLPFRLPEDVAARIVGIIGEWRCAAGHALAADRAFVWRGAMDAVELRTLATYWLNLCQLSDGELAAIGIAWPADAVRPFHEAVARGVEAALATAETTEPFSHRLRAAIFD